jgi:hypothetical protein
MSPPRMSLPPVLPLQYVNLSFLGIFTFTAPYLPWVLLAFSLMLGSSPLVDLLGMGAGEGGREGDAGGGGAGLTACTQPASTCLSNPTRGRLTILTLVDFGGRLWNI